MNLKKSLLSKALVITMLSSISLTAFAAEGQPEKTVPHNPTIELVDKIEFKSLPEMDISELVEDSSLSTVPTTRYSYSNIKEGKPLTNNTETRGVTKSWTGTLDKQGDFTYYLATLAPTQILNATLVCPKNPDLNYDLFVFEVDANGKLGNAVSSSTTGTYFNTYPNGIKKTIDEGVSYINDTSTTNKYAVIVSATKGGSNKDSFELTLGLDVKGNYDVAEPNDSPYKAYGIKEGKVSGPTLHVKNDQDWYVWNATSEFRSAKISATAGYKVEVYTANGNNVILTNQNSDGSFPIANGVNYIRVFADGEAFTPSAYSLSITPWALTPAKMLVLLDGDEGEKSYPSYPEGKHFRFEDKLCPRIRVLSASGYGVPNQPVTLYWESGSWTEQSGNKSRTITGTTNSVGVTTLVLEEPNLPVSIGAHSVYLHGPIKFTHYYDIDGIMISSPGVKPYTDVVYHFAYSIYEGN